MKYQIHQLAYENNTIVKKEAVKLHVPHKDVTIVFHVFYIDVWKEIKSYLDQLTISYDLYITVPEGMDDAHIISIFNDHPNITIYKTENRGRDVLPFLQVMHLIGTDTYKYICKLHTKKTGDSALGNVWRKLLYYDLLGSDKTVSDIINSFESDENVGMITGKNTILDSQRYTYGNTEKIDLPKSNVLQFITEDGSKISIRPSGTEPKIKFYFGVKDNLESRDDYEKVNTKLDNKIIAIQKDLGII